MGGLVGGFTWVLSVRWVDMWAIWWVFELAGCLVGELTCVQSGGMGVYSATKFHFFPGARKCFPHDFGSKKPVYRM